LETPSQQWGGVFSSPYSSPYGFLVAVFMPITNLCFLFESALKKALS
jgi:hypothetical protein